ncbi:hypothetical protein IFM89_006136 [Coptis chinensis]|uniref:Uncharacterized protein n=1 Tax=Coptis chinensis TaxID=261450 RepID=A0A835GXD2_9MAGN|nr:hypothetical protein IFM89_006136 [Coptis chinensis]
MQSRSRKRKSVLRSSLGSARVLRPRENGLCKAPDPTDISANVSVERNKKRKMRKRTNKAVDDEFSRTRRRLRYLLYRMGYEHNYIDAYSGEGWKRQSDTQTTAAADLRLLAKHKMDNRVIIAHCSAIPPLISLLYLVEKLTQEHAVTTLLNLSINENNKNMIAKRGAIEPLIHVLKSKCRSKKRMEATNLFNPLVLEEYKMKIGRFSL